MRSHQLLWLITGMVLVGQTAIAQTDRPPSGPDVDRNPVAAALAYAQRTGAVPLILRVKRPILPAGVATPMAVSDLATQTVNSNDLMQKRQLTADLVNVTVNAKGFQDLIKNHEIDRIYIDTLSLPLLQNSVPIIHANTVQNIEHFTGDGFAIVVVDTGVDGNHPALKGKIIREKCFSSTRPDFSSTSICPDGTDVQTGAGAAKPCQGFSACSHGTHVAGIAVSARGTYNGKPIIGVAPRAKVVAIQVYSKFKGDKIWQLSPLHNSINML